MWLAAKSGDFPGQRRTPGCAERKAADGPSPSEDLQVGTALPWQKLSFSGSALVVANQTFQVRELLKGEQIMRLMRCSLTLLKGLRGIEYLGWEVIMMEEHQEPRS